MCVIVTCKQRNKIAQQNACCIGLQAGDASGTGLFDTAKRTFDSQRLGSIDSGLEDKFPQLIGPNEVRAAPHCSLPQPCGNSRCLLLSNHYNQRTSESICRR